MAITVDWLLTQELMKGFNILAGDTSMATEISGINIIDNPDTIPWLSKGTLVLSTGYLFTDSSLADNLISELSERGCAGLGIKMNRYLKELPKSMLEQAEKYHFPIIDIPFSSTMEQIANLIYRKLYADELDETTRLSVLYRDITECIFQRQELSKILPLISTAVNGSVFLTNDSFEIIEYTMSDSCHYSFPFPFCKDSYTLFSDSDISYLKANMDTQLPVITHTVSVSNKDLNFQIYPLTNRRNLLGFLIILKDDQITDSTYNFILNMRSVLTIALMNHSILTESERSSRDVFFHTLLSGNLKTEQEIEPLCIQNNFDFKRKRICIVLQIPEYEDMTIAKRRPYEKKIYSLFNEFLAENNNEFVKAVFQTCFVIFLYIQDNFSLKEETDYGINAANKLINGLNLVGIHSHAGISMTSSGSTTIYPCYLQALQALNIGQQLHPNNSCHSYYTDYIYHTFIKHYTHNDLLELYNETLGLLEQYDLNNQSELMLTLSTYLKCQGNITQTAKELFIHRNTMFYRLEQIKEIMHIDFDNQDDMYRIQTGFYIKKILDIL